MSTALPALLPLRLPRLQLPALLLLLAILTGLTCLGLLLSTGPADTLPTTAQSRPATGSLIAAPIYNEPGAEAFEHAQRYLESIDTALSNGLAVLRSGDAESITAQNRYFNALVNAGYAQFGASYYDPLGSCGVAGSSARQLWHIQVRALSGADQGNVGSEVRRAGAVLKSDRQACLESVQISLEAPQRWTPAALAEATPKPRWQSAPH